MESGTVSKILNILASFPTAEDVTLEVVDAALGLLGHLVSSQSVGCQNAVREAGGIAHLARLLHHCLDAIRLQSAELLQPVPSSPGQKSP